MAKEKEKKLEFTPESFSVTIGVFPQIAMVRENALKLATNLANHLELTDIHMSDESWEFRRPQPRQGHTRGQIKVKVEDHEVSIEHKLPIGGLERFERLVEKVVVSVGPVIKPQMIFFTSANLEYVVDVGGDARQALVDALGMPEKLGVLERPCHYVALRLGFPPYRIAEDDDDGHEDAIVDAGKMEGEEDSGKLADENEDKGADWQATLTLQTLQDETTNLSVEVEGRWMRPEKWKDPVDTLVERLQVIDNFLRTKITEFIQHFGPEE